MGLDLSRLGYYGTHMRESKPKPLRVTAIRLTDRDNRYIAALRKSGHARNRTDAIRFALQFTAEKVAA